MKESEKTWNFVTIGGITFRACDCECEERRKRIKKYEDIQRQKIE